MGITTRSLYGLKFVMYLIDKGSRASVREVSEKENIPYRYLERIVQDLRKNGIVFSYKGKGGGVELCNPENVTLKDIVRVLDGSLLEVPCMPPVLKVCEIVDSCSAKKVWEEFMSSIEKVCGKIKLMNYKRRN
ncbi:Rrf2 family transcriptional regulator [candidate division WOR-3 bacterium]|nr:Rrf2 family transcriptional regulator [candidate division WOR-3 bacterium]